MICPACHTGMVEEDFGGVMVDVCKNGCKGIWFDWMELIKLDEEHEGAGQAMLEALESPRMNDENRGKITCPKCNIPMYVHKYSKTQQVNVDECYQCGGFFLDAGELKVIKDTYMTEEEEKEFVQKLLNGIPEYQQLKEETEKSKNRAEAINKMTRFFRISRLFKK